MVYPPVLLLVILTALHLTAPIFASTRLCNFAMTGSFNSTLLNIAWLNFDKIAFYFSTGQYVQIPAGNLGHKNVQLTDNTAEESDYSNELYQSWKVPQLETLKGLYRFHMKYSKLSTEAIGALVVTTEKLRMFDVRSGTALWTDDANGWISIIYHQNGGSGMLDYSDVFGYVLRKDDIARTHDTIIFQLWLEGEELKLTVESNPDTRHFYYLDGSTPNQLTLVHRSNRRMSRITLPFEQLTTGIMKDGKVHIFDDALGCVAIISMPQDDLAHRFKESTKNLNYSRLDVPYENYFLCPEQFKPDPKLDANRCGNPDPDDPVTPSKFKILFIGTSLLTVAALMVCLWFFVIAKDKDLLDMILMRKGNSKKAPVVLKAANAKSSKKSTSASKVTSSQISPISAASSKAGSKKPSSRRPRIPTSTISSKHSTSKSPFSAAAAPSSKVSSRARSTNSTGSTI